MLMVYVGAMKAGAAWTFAAAPVNAAAIAVMATTPDDAISRTLDLLDPCAPESGAVPTPMESPLSAVILPPDLICGKDDSLLPGDLS
jgi:hypothetical protein